MERDLYEPPTAEVIRVCLDSVLVSGAEGEPRDPWDDDQHRGWYVHE